MFFHTEQISQNWKLMGTKVCCHAVQKISIWCCYVWRNLQKRAGFIVLQFKVNLCDHACHWAAVPVLHPRRVRIWERDSQGSPTPLCKSFPLPQAPHFGYVSSCSKVLAPLVLAQHHSGDRTRAETCCGVSFARLGAAACNVGGSARMPCYPAK